MTSSFGTSGTAQAAPYGRRVREIVAARGNLCVGIDPHPALLERWGLTNDAIGLREFSQRTLEACGDVAAAIKPQVAFFEAHGAAGMAVLEQVLWEAKDTGALVIADAKRGDIGSTLAAYAQAWLTPGAPFHCDAVTLSPYLGVGALEPAFHAAEAAGRGVYVLSATSNPEARALQDARVCGEFSAAAQGAASGFGAPGEMAATEPSESVAQAVADAVTARNRTVRGGADPSFGLVIGATVENPPNVQVDSGPLLIPGFGAQGGGVADVARVAGAGGWGALINVSRQILAAGPTVRALADAARDVNKQLAEARNSP